MKLALNQSETNPKSRRSSLQQPTGKQNPGKKAFEDAKSDPRMPQNSTATSPISTRRRTSRLTLANVSAATSAQAASGQNPSWFSSPRRDTGSAPPSPTFRRDEGHSSPASSVRSQPTPRPSAPWSPAGHRDTRTQNRRTSATDSAVRVGTAPQASIHAGRNHKDRAERVKKAMDFQPAAVGLMKWISDLRGPAEPVRSRKQVADEGVEKAAARQLRSSEMAPTSPTSTLARIEEEIQNFNRYFEGAHERLASLKSVFSQHAASQQTSRSCAAPERKAEVILCSDQHTPASSAPSTSTSTEDTAVFPWEDELNRRLSAEHEDHAAPELPHACRGASASQLTGAVHLFNFEAGIALNDDEDGVCVPRSRAASDAAHGVQHTPRLACHLPKRVDGPSTAPGEAFSSAISHSAAQAPFDARPESARVDEGAGAEQAPTFPPLHAAQDRESEKRGGLTGPDPMEVGPAPSFEGSKSVQDDAEPQVRRAQSALPVPKQIQSDEEAQVQRAQSAVIVSQPDSMPEWRSEPNAAEDAWETQTGSCMRDWNHQAVGGIARSQTEQTELDDGTVKTRDALTCETEAQAVDEGVEPRDWLRPTVNGHGRCVACLRVLCQCRACPAPGAAAAAIEARLTSGAEAEATAARHECRQSDSSLGEAPCSPLLCIESTSADAHACAEREVDTALFGTMCASAPLRSASPAERDDVVAAQENERPGHHQHDGAATMMGGGDDVSDAIEARLTSGAEAEATIARNECRESDSSLGEAPCSPRLSIESTSADAHACAEREVDTALFDTTCAPAPLRSASPAERDDDVRDAAATRRDACGPGHLSSGAISVPPLPRLPHSSSCASPMSSGGRSGRSRDSWIAVVTPRGGSGDPLRQRGRRLEEAADRLGVSAARSVEESVDLESNTQGIQAQPSEARLGDAAALVAQDPRVSATHVRRWKVFGREQGVEMLAGGAGGVLTALVVLALWVGGVAGYLIPRIPPQSQWLSLLLDAAPRSLEALTALAGEEAGADEQQPGRSRGAAWVVKMAAATAATMLLLMLSVVVRRRAEWERVQHGVFGVGAFAAGASLTQEALLVSARSGWVLDSWVRSVVGVMLMWEGVCGFGRVAGVRGLRSRVIARVVAVALLVSGGVRLGALTRTGGDARGCGVLSEAALQQTGALQTGFRLGTGMQAVDAQAAGDAAAVGEALAVRTMDVLLSLPDLTATQLGFASVAEAVDEESEEEEEEEWWDRGDFGSETHEESCNTAGMAQARVLSDSDDACGSVRRLLDSVGWAAIFAGADEALGGLVRSAVVATVAKGLGLHVAKRAP